MRYNKRIFIQPTRVIPSAITDIVYTFKETDSLDNLADEYYDDPNLSWVIMCANPTYFLEFDIKAGDKIRIPLPISRVWKLWGETTEI